MERVLLEVALESLADIEVAVEAGADRVELCSALDLGGLTPSIGTLRAATRLARVPVMAMIRPRPGGFTYDERELRAMRDDALAAIDAGAAGVVFGVLRADGSVDQAACEVILNAIPQTQTVFHRAFDLTKDAFQSFDAIAELGITRILTSGQRRAATETQAVERIARLIDYSKSRVEILPGAGIRSANVEQLVRETRCRQIHGTFRSPCNQSDLGSSGVEFGFGIPGAGAVRGALDANELRATRRALDRLDERT